MKKLGILVGVLALSALTGCLPGKGGNKEAEQRAVEDAKDQTIAMVSGSGVLTPDLKTNIGHNGEGHYNNDYLYLTTKQTYTDRDTEKDYIVDIEWTYDTNDSFVLRKDTPDDSHIGIYFNYSKTEEHDFAFSGKLTCGSADAVTLNYEVHLLLKDVDFMEVSLEQIYEVKDNDFKLVNHETGYYASNNPGLEDFPYACVETYGKVLYLAPDGNWGLIGDGNYILELYSGSAMNLKPEKYAALKVGNVVRVAAELGSYYGNCQVSYIFDISMADASKITEPAGYTALSGSAFNGKHYWEGGLMNSLRTATVTITGAKTTKGSRYTYAATIDGVAVTVAYDYHVDTNQTDKVDAKLGNLTIGQTLTLKGTFRFAGVSADDKKVTGTYKTYYDQTSWSLVPFLPEHVG